MAKQSNVRGQVGARKRASFVAFIQRLVACLQRGVVDVTMRENSEISLADLQRLLERECRCQLYLTQVAGKPMTYRFGKVKVAATK